MANSYLQFCQALELLTPAEIDWWKRHLITFDDALAKAGVESAADVKDDAPLEVQRLRAIAWGSDQEEYGFWHSMHDQDGKQTIAFFASDNGTPEHVAKLVHLFFKDMRPAGEDKFVLTWAETCSRSLPGAFSGGTVVATKQGLGWCSTTDQEWMATAAIKEDV